MLDLFRRRQRGLKFTLWIVIFALGAGMVLLFVDTPSGVSGNMGSQDVAVVDGKSITALEFRNHYSQIYELYRQVYKLDEQDPAVVKQLGLGQQTLNQLISNYALLSAAERMNFSATPEEIAAYIFALPSFQENGRFIGTERYKQILLANNLTTAQFENSVRQEIIRTKLEKVLTDGLLVSPEEVRQEFANRNQEAKVRYVYFDPAQLAQAEPSDSELKKYYEKNRDSYKTSERRRVKYFTVELDPKAVKVTEEQIKARLSSVPKQEQVRASHILLRSEEGKENPNALKKAEDLLKQLKSGADFAQLAREHSEDPATASKGGDLGFFGRGQMVPEFENVAFSLPAGQISEIVKTPFGYHIIKVTEAGRTDADAQRPVAEFELRQEEANRQALNRANRIAADLKKSGNIEQVGRSHKLPIRESVFFGLGDSIPGLFVRSDFNQQVFVLKKGDVTDPYSTSGAYIVAQLSEINPPHVPSFEEIRVRVLEDHRSEARENAARERAFSFSKDAQASGFDQSAQKAGLSVATTGFFKKGATVDDILKFSPELHDRAFRMSSGEIAPPIQVAGKYVVFQVVEKSELNPQQFEQEKVTIEQELLTQKRAAFLSAYLQNLVDGLRAENKIIINQDLVNSITG
ncbi:MAG: peptidylprolyl isomerase [Acidobacteria bacterium]|nr:peptidylprolyl isomerase [Acidobacteriota bacterium]